jgi:dolichol-phosphate mannosyltransferase
MSAGEAVGSVLVTGAAGFVGANLTRRLLAENAIVHVLLAPNSDRWRLGDLEHLVIHEGSLEDREVVHSLVSTTRPRWVFHLAAHGAYSNQRDYARIVNTNTLGTFHLLDALSRLGGCAGFVHTGSSSEYGIKDHPPTELEHLSPNSVYAVAKCAATHATSLFADLYGLPAVTVRLYSVFGPWEEPTRLMPRLIARALDNRLPKLSSPETARDFVWVDDVVDAVLVASRRARNCPGAIWNIGTGKQTSLRDLVTLIRSTFAVTAEPTWGSMADRTWDTDCWVADPTLAEKQLHWHPTTPLVDGLLAFADWLRSGPCTSRYV